MAIYKFKSKATGDLIMTQPVGRPCVLALIGKAVTPQGIIEVDQMPAAMSALEAAVAAEKPEAGGRRRRCVPRRPIRSACASAMWARWWKSMKRQALAEKQAIVWGT